MNTPHNIPNMTRLVNPVMVTGDAKGLIKKKSGNEGAKIKIKNEKRRYIFFAWLIDIQDHFTTFYILANDKLGSLPSGARNDSEQEPGMLVLLAFSKFHGL